MRVSDLVPSLIHIQLGVCHGLKSSLPAPVRSPPRVGAVNLVLGDTLYDRSVGLRIIGTNTTKTQAVWAPRQVPGAVYKSKKLTDCYHLLSDSKCVSNILKSCVDWRERLCHNVLYSFSFILWHSLHFSIHFSVYVVAYYVLIFNSSCSSRPFFRELK